MPETKLHNRQLPDTIKSKTIDSTNTISTDLTKLSIAGGTNGQVLSTNGSGSLSFITAGGGVSDGDKGDITVSSSGATWTIDNDAVTYAKIQNVTTNCLLGRVSAGSGDTEEITIGSGLTVTGTTLSASGGTGSPTVYIVKSADETVINSNTFQDDDHLFTTLDANSYYYGEFRLLFTRSNATTQSSIRFTIGANSLGYAIGLSATYTNQVVMSGVISLGSVTLDKDVQIPMTVKIYFTVKTGVSTQDLKLRFAQNSVNATTGATLMKGSSLILWKTTTV